VEVEGSASAKKGGHVDIDAAVMKRYSDASTEHQPDLCCPVDYDPAYLRVIPEEVLERDYGCGDPVSHVRPGDVVLDLGSGGGKVCFIAAQMAGPDGRVIGVDANDDMLNLARAAAPRVADRLGYANVTFLKGRIEDLRLDTARVERQLAAQRPSSFDEWHKSQQDIQEQRQQAPLIPDESVSLVLSNCVLNLVSPEEKGRMFAEIHRVLRPGGRAVISDIVSDEEVPEAMRTDPELWSGCYSGAMREDVFVQAFSDAGLYGITVLKRDDEPWQVVDGVEFRSITVAAYKGKEGMCWDHNEAVVYRGPFLQVADDDGHLFRRGERTAVCHKTFSLLGREPYAGQFDLVKPYRPVAAEEATAFPCDVGILLRDPRATKNGPLPTAESAGTSCDC
jgi:ubiquinone/menaquinone biosynthesis C-methylase UbiE